MPLLGVASGILYTVEYSAAFLTSILASQVSGVKNPPAKQEVWVQSLGRKVPLEKEMATHSSTLTWRIPWTEEPGRPRFMGRKESDTTDHTHWPLSTKQP